MLTLLPGFPSHVLAVSGSGEVTGRDYREILEPAIAARLKHGKPVDFYYRLGADFTGFSPGAMWEDARVGFAHWDGWGRIAVVTDIRWIVDAVWLFRPLFPNPVRVFTN